MNCDPDMLPTDTVDTSHIHTVSSLMSAAGAALEARDIEALERLDSISRGWIQDGQEASGQASMLAAMIDAAYTLQDLEN